MEKTIDVEKVLESKMGSKAKLVPGFVVRWLRKIIHEDQVNAFLWDSRNLSGTEWLTECVKYLDMTLKIEGRENLPDKNGRRCAGLYYRTALRRAFPLFGQRLAAEPAGTPPSVDWHKQDRQAEPRFPTDG